MNNTYCLNYLKQQLKLLSSDSSTQQQMIPKEIMWNIASDIANEWDYEYIEFFVEKLLNDHLITESIKDCFCEICNNFEKVSKNGAQFDIKIWTKEGLIHHPFWEHQRKLAKQLLKELDKIQL